MIPKIKKLNLSNQLITIIIELIETGQWEVGLKLPNEIELSSSFNVSRNIMRESMKVLENFGILSSKTGIGTYVSENAMANIHNMQFFENLKSNSTIEALLETRLILEPELAYYATLRSTDEELEELISILESDAQKHEVTEFFHDDDFDFHLKLAKFSRNLLCENFIQSILHQLKSSDYGKINMYVEKKVKEESINEHEYLIDAMRKRDPLLAKEIMYKHIFTRISVINSSYNTDMVLSKKIEKTRLKKNSAAK